MRAVWVACLLASSAMGAEVDFKRKVTAAMAVLQKPGIDLADGQVKQAIEDLKAVGGTQTVAAADLMWVYYANWQLARQEDHLHGNVREAIKRYEALIAVMAANPNANQTGLLVNLHFEAGRLYMVQSLVEMAKKHLTKAKAWVANPAPFFGRTNHELSLSDKFKVDLMLADCDAFDLSKPIDVANHRKVYLAIRDRVRAEFKAVTGQAAEIKKRELAVEQLELEALIVSKLADIDSRTSNLRLSATQCREALAIVAEDMTRALAHFRDGLDQLPDAQKRVSAGRYVDLAVSAGRLELALRIGNVKNLVKLTLFDEAAREFGVIEALMKRHPFSERDKADFLVARGVALVESCGLTLENAAPDAADRLAATLTQADEFVRAGSAIYHKLSNQDSDVFLAVTHFTLAQIAECRGRVPGVAAGDRAKCHRDAVAECDASLRHLDGIIKESPAFDLVLHVRRLRAGLLAKAGKAADAKPEADEILAAFVKRHGPEDIGVADFHRLLQDVEDRLGDPKAAWRHAVERRRLSAKLIGSYLATLPPGEVVRWFRRWDDPCLRSCLQLALRHPDLAGPAAEVLLNGKAKIAEVVAAVSGPDAADPAASEAHRKAAERMAYLLHGFPEAAKEDAAAVEKEIALVEAELRDAVVRRKARPRPGWHQIADVQAKLGPRDIFVDLFALPVEEHAAPQYHAWLVTAGGVDVIRLGDAGRIDDLIAAFTKHLGNCALAPYEPNWSFRKGHAAAEDTLKRVALKPLSELVLHPILAHRAAAGKDRWIVCPDLDVWNVPWGALVLPGGEYAVEKVSFRQVISGRDLLQPERAAAAGPAWVMANPDYDRPPAAAGWKYKEQMKRLEAAKEEADAVVGHFKETWHLASAVQGADTTKQALFGLAAPPRVLWLSTHGASPLPTGARHDDPLFSCGLYFAGSNYLPERVPAAGGSLPGLLTGAEVLFLRLQGTELVVLSACQSGTGRRVYGQSPTDLRQAFHVAGAKSVLASLWSVPDRQTKELMVSFVEKRATADNAAALRQAQTAMIDSLRRDNVLTSSHPFFWAAFTLTGP